MNESETIPLSDLASTRALGEKLAAQLLRSKGGILALAGPLGAGKTELTRAVVRSLSYQGEVTSPTFTLLHEYHGQHLPIYHLDFYRCDHPSEILSLGWDDWLDTDCVIIAEWADKFPPLFRGQAYIAVQMTHPTENQDRTAIVTHFS